MSNLDTSKAIYKQMTEILLSLQSGDSRQFELTSKMINLQSEAKGIASANKEIAEKLDSRIKYLRKGSEMWIAMVCTELYCQKIDAEEIVSFWKKRGIKL